jgi:hypothetical protein
LFVYRGPVIVKVVPPVIRGSPVSIDAFEFSLVVGVATPRPSQELERNKFLGRNLRFDFYEAARSRAVGVVAKHGVHGLENKELKLGVVPTEDQLGDATSVISELGVRHEPCLT